MTLAAALTSTAAGDDPRAPLKSVPSAPKSIPLALSSLATGPTGASIASAEQVTTLWSDGGCCFGSRVCCHDDIAEPAVADILGNGDSNIPKYRAIDPDLPVPPVAPPLGSIYPLLLLIDVENEVFE